MILVSIVHRISDGFWFHFWCFFDTFTVRTCNLLNHQKQLFFQWISMILIFRETWFLMIFLIFSVTSFSNYFWWVLASNLAPFRFPLASNFMFLGDHFLTVFWIAFYCFFCFSSFDRKGKIRCKKATFPEAQRNARGCWGGIKEGVQELGTRFW